MRYLYFIVVAIAVFCRCVLADEPKAPTTQAAEMDWTGLLGPNRNGINEGASLSSQWPTDGPPRIWRIPCNTGHAGPMIKDGILVLMDRPAKPKLARGAATSPSTAPSLPEETIHGINAETGQELWHVSYPCDWAGDQYFYGPAATPAATSDGKVICLCASGGMHCLDLKTGKAYWDKDIVGEYHNAVKDQHSTYDPTSSPLVAGDLLLLEVCSNTAGVVAWHIADGSVAWQTGGFPNYGSSLGYMNWQNIPAAIIVTKGTSPAEYKKRGQDVLVIDCQTGKLLWTAGAQKSYYNTPIAIANDNLVMVEGGGGDGPSFAFIPPDAQGAIAKTAWTEIDHNVRFSNFLIYKGQVFGQGFHGHGGPHTLWCTDAKTGKLLWQHEVKELHQWMLGSDSKVIQLHEDGQLSMFDAAPADSYKELARTKITGHTWAVPALVRGKLFVRSDTELVCLDLRAK